MLKILSLNFLVCHGQNDTRLFISAVIFKNKIFVGEYSAKEAQHLFENELSYLRHYQFIYTMEHILQIR